MSSVKRPLDGSIGSQVHFQGDAKKVKLNVQKEDIDQGKLKILLLNKKLKIISNNEAELGFCVVPANFRYHPTRIGVKFSIS